MIPNDPPDALGLNPFGSGAPLYREAGWLGTLPLPKGAKHPPPKGYTGHGAPQPTNDTVADWVEQSPTGNIALRLGEVPHEYLPAKLPPVYAGQVVDGWELIGIDVDDGRDGKSGGAQRAELEAELGELPATLLSTARWYDPATQHSCIAAFLVPKGYRFMGKAAEAIDVVQKRHRYMVVWPSLNPETATPEAPQGMPYRWFWGKPSAGVAAAERVDGVPGLGRVAVLPEPWFTYLSSDGTLESDDPISELAPGELLDWMKARPGWDKPMCRVMAKAAEKWAATAAESTDTHTVMTSAHWRILNLAAEGHAGCEAALNAFADAAYRDGIEKRGPEVFTGEVGRSVTGALSKIEPTWGDYMPDDTCAPEDSEVELPSVWPAPGAPLEVAKLIVEYRKRQRRHMRYWGGVWFSWTGTHYQELEEDELNRQLYEILGCAVYLKKTKGGFEKVDWDPTKFKLSNVIHAMRGLVALPKDMKANSWIDGRDEPVVPCLNGLVRLSDRKELDHTPEFFNIFCVPCDYDKAATSPALERFNRDAYGDDVDMRKLTQEYGGYVLSGRTDLHKSLVWIGGTRCGKGTYVRILKRLLGKDAYLGTDSSNLSDRFGLEAMVGKSLVVFPDERQPSAPAGKHLVNFLLKVNGDDDMSIRRKNKSDWTGQPFMRVIYVTNEAVTLPDPSGAVMTRLLIVDSQGRTWKGKEDPQIEVDLANELSGVLNHFLDGLDRLNANGGEFTRPESANDVIEDIDNSSNNMRSFLDSGRVILLRGATIRAETLLQMYRQWDAQINGNRDADRLTFRGALGKQLRAAMNDMAPEAGFKRVRVMENGERFYEYHGLDINPDWKPEQTGLQQKWVIE